MRAIVIAVVVAFAASADEVWACYKVFINNFLNIRHIWRIRNVFSSTSKWVRFFVPPVNPPPPPLSPNMPYSGNFSIVHIKYINIFRLINFWNFLFLFFVVFFFYFFFWGCNWGIILESEGVREQYCKN